MLRGHKIHLRLLENEDLPLRVQWVNDDVINENLGFDWPLSLSKTQVWFQNSLKDNSKINFVIIDNDSCKPIGMAGQLGVDYKNRNAEFYITIGDKSYWGLRISDEVIF